jgi:hypothetical protein
MILDVALGVLFALVVYRALATLGTELLRSWVRYDRRRGLTRHHSWMGGSSRPWRLMQRLGIEEARSR